MPGARRLPCITLPTRCDLLGFVVRTQQVVGLEINGRNAPAGFGLRVSVQRGECAAMGGMRRGRVESEQMAVCTSRRITTRVGTGRVC